tara:strand:- start:226 stop:873 length:648 start_codon:yes stop_codon:yes gene_type:complete
MNLLSLNSHFDKNSHLSYDQKYKGRNDENNNLIIKNVFGIFFYIIVFIVIIPVILFRTKHYEILEVYMPNIDLIATSLSFDHGPFNSGVFEFLYLDNRPLIGFLSQNMINYIVLISIMFLVVKESVIDKKTSTGLSKAAIIILATYLLPGRLIMNVMHYCNGIFDKFIKNNNILWFVIVLIGLVLTSFIIKFEAILIELFGKDISKIIDNILKKI